MSNLDDEQPRPRILMICINRRFRMDEPSCAGRGSEALADRPILIVPVLLVGLGVQSFAIGLLGELILFFQARRQRDYRVGAIHQGTNSY